MVWADKTGDAAVAAGYTRGRDSMNSLMCWTKDRGLLPVAARTHEGRASAASDSAGALQPTDVAGPNDTHADHLA